MITECARPAAYHRVRPAAHHRALTRRIIKTLLVHNFASSSLIRTHIFMFPGALAPGGTRPDAALRHPSVFPTLKKTYSAFVVLVWREYRPDA